MIGWVEHPLPSPPPGEREWRDEPSPLMAGLRLLLARDEVVSALARRSRADFRPLPTLQAESREALTAAFSESAEDAPPGLVAELAPLLVPRFERVAARLRRRVGRTREVVPLRAVRELDPACLRKIARLPGRTMIQKAGPRQRLPAVVREERFDTTENRILKAVCARLARRIERLQRSWSSRVRAEPGPRARALTQLRRACETVLARPELSKVGTPRPGERASNALLGDADYRAAWRAWQLLRGEEDAFLARWDHLDEAWSEILALALHARFERELGLEPVPGWIRIESGQADGCRVVTGGPRVWLALQSDEAALVSVERKEQGRIALTTRCAGDGPGTAKLIEVQTWLGLEDGQLRAGASWGGRTESADGDWIDGASRIADQLVQSLDLPLGSYRAPRSLDEARCAGLCALDRALVVAAGVTASPGRVAASALQVPEEADLFVHGRPATWLTPAGPTELHSTHAEWGGRLLADYSGARQTAVVVPNTLNEAEAVALRRGLGSSWLVWSVVAAALAAAQKLPELLQHPDTPRQIGVVVFTDACTDVAVLEQRRVVHEELPETLWVRSVPGRRAGGRERKAGAAGRGGWLRERDRCWELADGDLLRAEQTNAAPRDFVALRRSLGTVDRAIVVGNEAELDAWRGLAGAGDDILLDNISLAEGAEVFLDRHGRGLPTWKDRIPRIAVEAKRKMLRVDVPLIDPKMELVGPGERVDYVAPTCFHLGPGLDVIRLPMRREGALAPYELRLEGPPLPLREPVEVRLHVRFQYGLQGVEGALVPVKPGTFERVTFRLAASSGPGADEADLASPPPRAPAAPLEERRRLSLTKESARLRELLDALARKGRRRGKTDVSPKDLKAVLQRLADGLDGALSARGGPEFITALSDELTPTLDWLLGVRRRKGAGKLPDLGRSVRELAARARAPLGSGAFDRPLIDRSLEISPRSRIRCLGLRAKSAPSPVWEALLAEAPASPAERGVWARALRDALRRESEAALQLADALEDVLGKVVLWVEEIASGGPEEMRRRRDDLFLLFDLIPQLVYGRPDVLGVGTELVQQSIARLDSVRTLLPEEVRTWGHREATAIRDEPIAVAIAWLQGRYESMAEVTDR